MKKFASAKASKNVLIMQKFLQRAAKTTFGSVEIPGWGYSKAELSYSPFSHPNYWIWGTNPGLIMKKCLLCSDVPKNSLLYKQDGFQFWKKALLFNFLPLIWPHAILPPREQPPQEIIMNLIFCPLCYLLMCVLKQAPTLFKLWIGGKICT